MIDIRQEELSILELLKYGKTGSIYKSTDLYLNTNVVKEAPHMGNGEPPFVSYRTESFYFNSDLVISAVVIDFDVNQPYQSLFSDYDYFKNLSNDDYFALSEGLGLFYSELMHITELDLDLDIGHYIINRENSKSTNLEQVTVVANYLTKRLNKLGIRTLG